MISLVSRRPLRVGIAVVAGLLTVGASLCLFDTDGDAHDGLGLDLCTALVPVTIAALAVSFRLIGNTALRLAWAATPVVVSIPHPPPWR